MQREKAPFHIYINTPAKSVGIGSFLDELRPILGLQQVNPTLVGEVKRQTVPHTVLCRPLFHPTALVVMPSLLLS